MSAEVPHLHEIVRPIREIVLGLGEWVVDKVIPQDVFTSLIQGESLQRTADAFDLSGLEDDGDS